MSFSVFSKDFTSNMFTSVENQFITKYLPQADGDAVRAYLYGLYLCSCKEEFDGRSMGKLLKIPYERLLEIYGFWEECDLVHILSRDPLYVEYLPVNAAVGKPKPIRPEKYSDFNREFYKILQRANADFKPYEMSRILEFLENNPMEQQAFLLIAEYCAGKDGEKLSSAHMLNKAKKLCKEQKFTCEQVERDLADFNKNERELGKLFSLLGIYKKPAEPDYELLEKWHAEGMEPGALLAAASALKKGSMSGLDLLVSELNERDLHTRAEAEEYLARRAECSDLVYKIARKLGVRIQNPRAYIETYAEKWLEHGYDGESLLLLSGLAFKLGYGFEELDALLDSLYADGIVDATGIRAYCAATEKLLRLLQSVQSVCGVVKKTQSALGMIRAWKSWNFSDEMILEAAKRSAGASAPLAYMNKLLSGWKRTEIFSPDAIPEKTGAKPDFRSEAAVAADLRADREHHYAVLRQRAASAAEQARKKAEEDEEFRLSDRELKKREIELAKAEVFSPAQVAPIREEIEQYRLRRESAMKRLNLTEEDFTPKYVCPKCSDTGFLPDGRACDCYRS